MEQLRAHDAPYPDLPDSPADEPLAEFTGFKRAVELEDVASRCSSLNSETVRSHFRREECASCQGQRDHTQVGEPATRGAMPDAEPENIVAGVRDPPRTPRNRNQSQNSDGRRRHGAQPSGFQEPEDEFNLTRDECLLFDNDARRDPTPVLGHGNATQWRPSQNYEDIVQTKITDTLTATLQELAVALKQPTMPRRTPYKAIAPRFEGTEWEDPNQFLRLVENYCRQEEYAPSEWTLVATDMLRGEAQRWFDAYRHLHLKYGQFMQHFLERYDGVAIRSKLQARLYGEQQKREEVSLFISRKLSLYRRLAPELDEVIMVQQIREMLLPQLRVTLRGSNITSVHQLTQLAMSIEADLKEMQRFPMMSTGASTANNQPMPVRAPQQQAVRGSRPPYPCRYCQGDHYNRDCPRQRPLNPPPQRRAIEPSPATTPNAGRDAFPTIGAAAHNLLLKDVINIPANSNRLPRISARFQGSNISALIDTGASHSFASQDLLGETIGLTYRASLADGTLINVGGPVKLNIYINGQVTTANVFVLPGITEDIILGMDWLEEEAATVDLKYHCLYFGKHSRQAAYWSQATHVLHTPEPVILDETNGDPRNQDFYQAILNEFPDLFSETLVQPTTNLVKHQIRLRDPTPFKIRRYQYSAEKKRIIYQEIDNMLTAGVIRRSHSAFNSPIVVVSKKDGTSRFCVDYRKLNSQTEDEVANLPAIRETLQELGNAKVFTSLDLKSGYWQVPMEESSIPLTAFSTPDGAAFEFLVMPFGLKCAPSTFQKLMVEVLAGYIDTIVKVYLDDIIIYSNNHEEHAYHLKLVLERLRSHGLKCSLRKCRFGAESLDYLGYRVTAQYNTVQERHVLRVQDFEQPKNMKELQSFLGAANWLREYVKDFAQISAPLTDLLGKRRFAWTPEAIKAFHRLKYALAQPLTLHRPDPQLPFVLQTDASARGMGAVLYQTTPSGERHIISCASAKFNRTEMKYHCNEQEVLATVWAIKRYRALLEDRRFTLRTDSRALQWLKYYQDHRAKLMRWALLLQEFNFQVEHCPGRENQLPDLLSRNPGPELGTEEIDEDRMLPPKVVTAPILSPEVSMDTASTTTTIMLSAEQTSKTPLVVATNPATVNSNKTKSRQTHARNRQTLQRIPRAFVTRIKLNQIDGPPGDQTLYEEIAQAQRDSPEYNNTRVRIQVLKEGRQPARQAWERTLKNNYSVEDDLVWFTKGGAKSLVVPVNYWLRVIHEYHDSPIAGHPGRDETIRAIERLYHWPALRRQVKTHIRNCLVCASTKRGGALQPSAPLRPHVPRRPWEVVSLDVMGPYPETSKGNRFILVATDLFSRWVEVQPVPTARAKPVVNFLLGICQRWGYPQQTITDNGPVFRSQLWKRFHQKNNMSMYVTPIYHQRSNPVERRNQELKKLLRVQLLNKHESAWDTVLSDVTFTLHNRRNEATGMTPSELLLGTNLVRPGEWAHPNIRAPVNNRAADRERRLQRARDRQNVYIRDLFPNPRDAHKHFIVGDLVLVRTFPGIATAFAPPWSGPYPVTAVRGANTYEVDRNGSQYLIHIDDLRPAPIARADQPQNHDLDEDQAPHLPVPQPPGNQRQMPHHPPASEDQAPKLRRREPQPGPSRRPVDPSEFEPDPETLRTSTPSSLATARRPLQPVTIEDFPDDPGDPNEARPVCGSVPVIGLYP